MTEMSITVKVKVDAKEALLRGRAEKGEAIITLVKEQVEQLTQEEREFLAKCSMHQEEADFYIYFKGFAEATFEELKRWLAAGVETGKKNAAQEAQRKHEENRLACDKVAAWIAGDDSWFGHIPQEFSPYTVLSVRAIDPALMGQAETERQTRVAQQQRAQEIKSAQEKLEREQQAAADAAQKATEDAFVYAWVREHGSEEIKAQLSEELLCREEALLLIKKWTLDPLGARAQYDFCERPEHKCGSDCVSCIPVRLYASWKSLKSKLPSSAEWKFKKVVPCLYTGDNYDLDDGLGKEFYVVEVKVKAGPFVFDHEIELK